MNKGETVFRLNEDGYPVFNADGLAELRQVWGSEEVMEYERPLLSLNTKGIEQKVTLPSGHVVIASLENNPEIKKQVIKDIGIGYKLSLDGQVVRLQPIWYVKLVEDETGKQKIYEWSEGGLNGLGWIKTIFIVTFLFWTSFSFSNSFKSKIVINWSLLQKQR